jgi:putative thiamine transport system ATP-binding protein
MTLEKQLGLRLEDVTLTVGERTLFGPISISVEKGKVLTVMGPSGSGKSTLLDFICGTLGNAFEAVGEVVLNGRHLNALEAESRRIGILYQDDLLFPHMSVGENLMFGLPATVRGRDERQERVVQALADAELEGFAGRSPFTLSGGQRARVALMRVLLSEPEALLLDEPFGALDKSLREQFRTFVFDHTRTLGLPTLLVTHDHDDASAASGVVVDLSSDSQ